jgi:hypothetical protein
MALRDFSSYAVRKKINPNQTPLACRQAIGYSGCPTLEIPEWMFDTIVCAQMKSTELPHVDSVVALLALEHLLSAATKSSEQDMVQAQHSRAAPPCVPIVMPAEGLTQRQAR